MVFLKVREISHDLGYVTYNSPHTIANIGSEVNHDNAPTHN